MVEDGARQNSGAKHKWKFFRSGGFDQVRLDDAADLQNLGLLDQKLWAALSCPAKGLEIDSKVLQYLDSDNDGRIRVPEITAAVRWICSVLKNPEDIKRGLPTLPLAAINDGIPEGKQLLAVARRILANLDKANAVEISSEDTADTAKSFLKTKFNGDGVVPPTSATDKAVAKVIEDIIACVGGVPDRSEAMGVDQAKLDQFFVELEAFVAWHADAETHAKAVMPLGPATPAAAGQVQALRAKIEDYFTRCRLAGFDGRATAPLNPSETTYQMLTAATLSAGTAELTALPLALITADQPLPLISGINPAWAGQIAKFNSDVVNPVLGMKTSLTVGDWHKIIAAFEPYEAWVAGKKGAAVEALGIARAKELLAGGSRKDIAALIAQDKALEAEANALDSVDKLVRYHRDLYALLCNFVSFKDFYTGKQAVFQAGRLFLDQRSCDLCIKVDDVAKHSALAQLSKAYLLYCDCTRRGAAEKMTIAAAVTNGDADNLMVGRNAIFYDRQGRDWDATVIKIIEHPISIRQAFWSPYKRVGRMIGEQIEKVAAARDKASLDKAAAGITTAGTAAETGAVPAPAPFDVGKFAGIFAAIGLAIGAIGTAIASVITGFIGLKLWQMPLAVIGILLLISGPSMIIAWLKLRQRNLAPLLDANGWAINTRAIMNIPFGTALTSTAVLPPGAERSLTDPYAEKKRPWRLYTVLLIIVLVCGFLWQQGLIKQWASQIKSSVTTEQTAPAADPATDPAAAPAGDAAAAPAEVPAGQ